MFFRCVGGVWLPAAILLAAGCQTVRPTEGSVVVDASFKRLQEISGHLLAYFAERRALPPDLEALREVRAADLPPLPPLISPYSGTPYVYVREPVAMAEHPGSLIIYDPATIEVLVRGESRSSQWAVLVAEVPGGTSLVAHVLPIPAREIEAAVSTRPR